jgi:ankyrin repeat protein
LALENNHLDVAKYILENFDSLDLLKRDTFNGNTYLHLACLAQDTEIIKLILAKSNPSQDKECEADKSFLRDIKLEIPGFSRAKKYEVTDVALM